MVLPTDQDQDEESKYSSVIRSKSKLAQEVKQAIAEPQSDALARDVRKPSINKDALKSLVAKVNQQNSVPSKGTASKIECKRQVLYPAQVAQQFKDYATQEKKNLLQQKQEAEKNTINDLKTFSKNLKVNEFI